MLINYDRPNKSATLQSDIETVDKAVELVNLFSEVPLDTLKAVFASDAGKLAHAVLCNQSDTSIVRMLIDEIQGEYLTSNSAKAFITRQALVNELEDILKAKTITPYRRSRINKALKRECIACHGSGKQPRKVDKGGGFGYPRVIRHEIDSRSPDCSHCDGTGIRKPVEVPTTGELAAAQDKRTYDNYIKEVNDELFKALKILDK